MPHPLEYVITGALLECSQGTVPMPFTATPRTTKIAGLLAGNALDKVPLVNIPSFVICKKLTQMAGGTPTPCMPAPTMWQETYPAKVGGGDALLSRSCITCPVGQGKISFLTSGQLPLPPAVSQDLKEAQEGAQESLEEAEKEKNSVGEASLAEGFIPVWGSGRDLIHSIQTGNKLGIAMNAGFLIWDVVSVAAGVVSFGTATAGMMAGKAGLRAALKAGSKVAVGMASKKLAATAAKAIALKEGLPAALKAFAKKIPKVCVTACFPAGTPVAVADGFKNIEDVEVGELVWSWQEETGDLALKPVTQTMRREADALVELQIGADAVRATPEHPFWANGAWKVAGMLAVGDELMRSDGLVMPVRAVTHHTEKTVAVYNLEVADWHTYLVSWWMFVVHNATVCISQIKKLLASEGKVAKFKDLIKKGKKGDDITPHHLPSDAYMKKHGIARKDGISINMEQPALGGRHRQTKTYGSNMTKAEREAYYKLSPRDAMAYDIKDVRKIYQKEGLYTDEIRKGIQDVIKQNKKIYPGIFGK